MVHDSLTDGVRYLHVVSIQKEFLYRTSLREASRSSKPHTVSLPRSMLAERNVKAVRVQMEPPPRRQHGWLWSPEPARRPARPRGWDLCSHAWPSQVADAPLRKPMLSDQSGAWSHRLLRRFCYKTEQIIKLLRLPRSSLALQRTRA